MCVGTVDTILMNNFKKRKKRFYNQMNLITHSKDYLVVPLYSGKRNIKTCAMGKFAIVFSIFKSVDSLEIDEPSQLSLSV